MALTVSIGLLVVAEGVLRLAVPESRLLFLWEQPDALVALTEMHWLEIRAHEDYEGDDGPYHWNVRTNAQALREDRSIPAEIPEGTRRILALGDSWVFGWSLDQGHTFPDALEKLLPARLGVESVEVVNGGKPTATTLDMFSLWRRLTAQIEVDGVVLGTSHNAGQLHGDLVARQTIYNRIQGAPYANMRLYLVLRRLLVPLTRPTYATIPTAREQGNTLEMMKRDLTRLSTEALARGLPVWFVNMPDTWETSVALRRTWVPYRRDLEDLGVLVTGHSLEQRSCWGFEDLGHPSEAGAWALAEVTADLMVRGTSDRSPRREPSCDDVAGAGLGKPDGTVVP